MSKIDEVVAEAEREAQKDSIEIAKLKIKQKFLEIANAKMVVRNLDHEYDVLIEELTEDIGD